MYLFNTTSIVLVKGNWYILLFHWFWVKICIQIYSNRFGPSGPYQERSKHLSKKCFVLHMCPVSFIFNEFASIITQKKNKFVIGVPASRTVALGIAHAFSEDGHKVGKYTAVILKCLLCTDLGIPAYYRLGTKACALQEKAKGERSKQASERLCSSSRLLLTMETPIQSVCKKVSFCLRNNKPIIYVPASIKFL